jgi:3-phosphoshikimate 1-carboxyvinyltransferase
VRPPGSKSITNRALLCAALAPGTSTLTGALFADDTRATLGAVAALGATVDADPEAAVIR